MSSIPNDIIIPPNEVRKMIEKTAQYVSKHGTAFEQKIKAKEANNPKFLFINKSDPYHGYYQYIIDTLKAKGKIPLIQERREVNIIPETEVVTIPNDPTPFKTLSIKDGKLDMIEKEMTLTDLNVLKMMARYSVQYSSNSIDLLKRMIVSNSDLNTHFGFLDNDNRFNGVYLRYQEIYKLVIIGRATMEKELKDNKFNQDEFLDECYNISKQIKEIKVSKSDAIKKKNENIIAYTSIDWQDFEIVETVVIIENDKFETPLTKETLKYRALIQKEANKVLDEEDQHTVTYQDEDEDDELPGYNENEQETSKVSYKVPKGMNIRAAGESRLKRKMEEGEKMLQCPLTKEMISESEFPMHLKKLLRDPKYEEERNRYESKFKYGDNLTSTQAWENINSIVNKFT